MHGTGCLLLVQILLFCRLIVSHLQLVPSAIPDVHGHAQVDYCHPCLCNLWSFSQVGWLLLLFFLLQLPSSWLQPYPVVIFVSPSFLYACAIVFSVCLYSALHRLFAAPHLHSFCSVFHTGWLLLFPPWHLHPLASMPMPWGEGLCSTISLSRSSLFRNWVRCCSVWNRWLVACANIACLLVVASPLCTCGHTQDDYCQPLLAQSMIFHKYIDCCSCFFLQLLPSGWLQSHWLVAILFSLPSFILHNCFSSLFAQHIIQVASPLLAQFLLCISHKLIVVIPPWCLGEKGSIELIPLSESSLFYQGEVPWYMIVSPLCLHPQKHPMLAATPGWL